MKMFLKELVFSLTLLGSAIGYHLYTKIDQSTNTNYQCTYIYLSPEFFRDLIFPSVYQYSYDYLIDELIQYCLVVEHQTINDDSCTSNGGIIWTFAQLKIRNITADHLIHWTATVDIIDRYEQYLHINDVELSAFRFCNFT